MKNVLIILFALFSHTALYSQYVSVIKITDLEERIRNNSDTTYIVNFWATWCVPCIRELPDLDSINSTFIKEKVKVLLVSLDFKEDLKTKLLTFIAIKKIKSEVVLLDELNANYFIPRVSNDWSGAIPATLIVNNQKKFSLFVEKKVNYDFLKIEIEKSFINN